VDEREETWPHGIVVRTRKQMQRDESRDRQKHTRGWYRDGVSYVEGTHAKPKWDGFAERSNIIRPEVGDAYCDRCKGTEVSYIDQLCYRCSPNEAEKE